MTPSTSSDRSRMQTPIESSYLSPHHIGKDDEDYTTGFQATSLDTPSPRSTGPTSDATSHPATSMPSGVDPVGLPSYTDPFYGPIELMSAAAIEAAFSGEHGDLREAPDAYHRAADTL